MNISIDVHDAVESGYNSDLLLQIAQKTIDVASVVSEHVESLTISVAIVSEDEIRRVNKEFRQKDDSTDVISVGDYSDDNDISKELQQDVFLGEVILCYNYIAQTASITDLSVDEEFFTVYAHGLLHLLGFEHGEEMFRIQKEVAKNFIKKV